MPAEAYASYAASTSRSSGPLSQCSPKGVHPMPTIATRSLMPLLAIEFSLASRSALRPRLPEVVMDTVRGEEAAERHLDLVADRDLVRLAVRHLPHQPATAFEVDGDGDGR